MQKTIIIPKIIILFLLFFSPFLSAQSWQTYITPFNNPPTPLRFVHQFADSTIIAARANTISKLSPQGDTLFNRHYLTIPSKPYISYFPDLDSVASIDIWSGTPTSDGNVILVGGTQTHTSDSLGQFYSAGGIGLIKINSQGDTLWTQRVIILDSAAAFITHFFGFDIREDADSNFVITGGALLSDSTDSSIFSFLKIDANGHVLHNYNISKNHSFMGRSIQPIDNGYIAVAEADIDSHDFTFLKLDSIGDTLWTKTFAMIQVDTPIAAGGGFPKKIRATSDGNFIVIGHIGDTPIWTGIPPYYFAYGGYDILIAKLDSLGNLLDYNAFGDSEGPDGLHDIRETPDGNFVAVGHYVVDNAIGMQFYIAKFNAQLDTIWTKLIYPNNNTQYAGMLHSLELTADGGYLRQGLCDEIRFFG